MQFTCEGRNLHPTQDVWGCSNQHICCTGGAYVMKSTGIQYGSLLHYCWSKTSQTRARKILQGAREQRVWTPGRVCQNNYSCRITAVFSWCEAPFLGYAVLGPQTKRSRSQSMRTLLVRLCLSNPLLVPSPHLHSLPS